MNPAIANVPGIAYKAESFSKTDSFCPTLIRKPDPKIYDSAICSRPTVEKMGNFIVSIENL